jgi:hypothetical protein
VLLQLFFLTLISPDDNPNRARLLQERKKTVPSQEWLRQLPHKARKLEERLYRNSTSLEAYLEKKTLKTRLKKLARIITNQFEEAKKRRILGTDRGSFASVLGWNQHPNAGILMRQRNSEVSTASAASVSSMASLAASSVNSSHSQSLRDSFSTANSLDTLRSFRESLVRGPAMTTSDMSNENHLGSDGVSSLASVSGPEPTNARTSPPTAAPLGSDGPETLPEVHSVDRDAKSRTKATSSPTIAAFSSSQTNSINQLTTGDGNKNTCMNSSPSQSGTGSDELLNGVTHEQPPVNAQLRQQILENLRRQEELTRRIQAHQLSNGINGAPLGHPSSAAYATNPGMPGGAVPGFASASHFPLSNLHSMAGSINPNQHYVSGLQLHPGSVMAAALLSRNLHGGGGGDLFTSMSAGGTPVAALHAAAAAGVSPPLVSTMNNGSSLHHAFLRASALNVLPGSLGQHKQHQQLPQPQSFDGTPMMPPASRLSGTGTLSDSVGLHAANYDGLLDGGMPPGHANLFPALTVPMPMPLPEGVTNGSTSMTPGVQQPSRSGEAGAGAARTPTAAVMPSGAVPRRAGLSEESEPLSPGSFNW